jgi:hypothetical protein
MNPDTALLAEMMLHSTQFCSKADTLSARIGDKKELDEFRLKLGQARNIVERLQEIYNDEGLDIDSKTVMEEFRQLVIALLWVGYYVRQFSDFRLFRMLVSIEASFTYLLLKRSA